MLDAVFMMGGLGLVVGAGLAVASKIFYVYVDPKVLAIEDALPGANCGGCGLPGCSANAEAIVAGRAAPNSCVAAGMETAVQIAGILGVSVEAKEPDIARPGCSYGVAVADTKFIYDGLTDCRAAALLNGGMKVCTIGCLGLGTCAQVCPFNAIVMGENGLPVVDPKKCTGCGTCERACPKHIITLSSVTRRILREYTLDECTTPCQRACPAGINIYEYIRQISLGNYHQSVQVIKERNPFPAVIGRICPRPCEDHCRRQLVDEPVAINYLKRFAADYEVAQHKRIQPFKAPETGRKVAVVGGGVEGLSAAFFLARLGHGPTVYESSAKLGGLLRSAIAAYRLPDDILQWDIDGILEMGVQAETHMALGKNITVETLLREGFEAVLTALGGWDSRLARGAVNELESPVPGCFLLLDVIRQLRGQTPSLPECRKAVVYGGDQLAAEAARGLKGRGAQQVTLIYRQSATRVGLEASELEALISQGIEVRFQCGVVRLYGENQRLTGLDLADMEGNPPEHVEADMLVLSSGRFPELIFFRARQEPGSSEDAEADTAAAATESPVRWVAVDPYKAPAFYTETGLLAEGDPFTDYSAAIRAIGAGRRAAASVHEIMYGVPLELPEDVVTPDSPVQDVDQVEHVPESHRNIMPLCEKDPSQCREIELGFEEHTARSEAGRCLQCGLICYRRNLEPAPRVGY
jgi:NADPH-dependent glutamate synthase beta subunit-like oxidoreductase